MRIALYGNVCNNFYTLAKALRNVMGVEAHLYLNDKVDIQNRPESDDPELAGNYPPWIHMSSEWDVLPFLKTGSRKFLKELDKYDVVFLSELGVVFTPFLKTKSLFYVTGGDLTITPFPGKFSEKFKSLKDRIVWEYIGYMQRRGIRHANKILTQPFFPFANALNELKVNKSKISNSYFPALLDVNSFKPKPGAWEDMDSYNREQLSRFKFIVFHPSRIVINQSKGLVESGQWKGNDNMIKGLAKFIQNYGVNDICLAMPDRIYSTDKDKAMELIQSLGIEENVVWLKPPTSEGFPRRQLLNFYSVSDIVADEFATGWFGLVVLEGMACGKTTFCYVDEEVMSQLYPSHPIVSVKAPSEIALKLAEFYFDPQKKNARGIASRKWVVDHHSYDKGTAIYISNFKRDLSDIIKLS